MKICFVHEEYPEETNFGGIATYQKIMAETLAKQNHEVYVICRGIEREQQYIKNNVNIKRIYIRKTKNSKKDLINYRKKVAEVLKKLQDENKIELIEVPDWGAETVFFEKYRKIPIIVRLHTPLKIWLRYNKNKFGKEKNIMLRWERKMLKKADYITCCSNILKKIIVKDFKIKEDLIHVTPNPANIKDFYYTNKEKENKIVFIGSLEERKGLRVLAHALNIVFEKYPNFTIDFIGKDTFRNSENISTKELIRKIIKPIYRNNINFLGQLNNKELNDHLNSSKIAVYPSLFDNFPYVVLESMSTGIHIIGSKNSGMTEMLNDSASIYNTGDSTDLAKKIITKIKLSTTQEINKNNIKRVRNIYNADKICKKSETIYMNAIKNYYIKNVKKNDIKKILNNNNIKKIQKAKQGVANIVFIVTCKDQKFVVKLYKNNYNFKLVEKLYKIYEKNEIDVIKPINKKLIEYKYTNHNIFEYVKPSKLKKNKIEDYIIKLMNVNRETTLKSTIKNKIDKYYKYLKLNGNKNKKFEKDLIYILENYEKIKENKIYNEQYINHGDISKSNIINNKSKKYIIDFDETTISTMLYDFGIAIIKSNNKKIKIKKYNKIIKELMKNNDKHKVSDYDNIIKLCICKILLEKFYLHEQGKIDVFSKEQRKDNYKKYIKMFKKIIEETKERKENEFLQ